MFAHTDTPMPAEKVLTVRLPRQIAKTIRVALTAVLLPAVALAAI
jgi:hypothetical protein